MKPSLSQDFNFLPKQSVPLCSTALTINTDRITHEETNWKSDINNYNQQKKTLEWGFNPKPLYIKRKDIIKSESIMNPITQVYNSAELNKKLNIAESANLKEKITNYYDNQLRNEQTFDIINLKDRLKGFENHPDYPKEKRQHEKLNKEISKAPYNIISNISLSVHNPLPPDKRPPPTKEEDSSIKQRMCNKNTYKDYDIINNRYKFYNDEKLKVEKELDLLNAAKSMIANKIYDPIRGMSYNPEVEEKYRQKENEKLNNVTRDLKRDSIINPINGTALMPKIVEERDKKEQDRIQRFGLRNQYECYCRNKNYLDDYKKEKNMNNKVRYERYRIEDQRGYDFINNQRTFEKYKNLAQNLNAKQPWDLLKGGINSNGTLSTKNIYISNKYESMELNRKFENFNKERNQFLNCLNNIKEDPTYQIKKVPSKFEIFGEGNQNEYKEQGNFKSRNIDIGSSFNKNEWFTKQPKDITASLQMV